MLERRSVLEEEEEDEEEEEEEEGDSGFKKEKDSSCVSSELAYPAVDLGGCMEAGGLLPHQPSQGPPGTGSGPSNINICTGGQQQQQNNRRITNHSPVHPGLDQLNAIGQLGLNNQQHLQLQQQMGQAPGVGEVLTPKRQAVVDRLRRRLENYRRHATDCIPRYDQSFTGAREQNSQDTLILKQRYLENKPKKPPKKTDKKPNESISLSNVQV
ncbi:hypothetical protein PV326_003450, partial [Microctonus aethiopoides]